MPVLYMLCVSRDELYLQKSLYFNGCHTALGFPAVCPSVINISLFSLKKVGWIQG